VALRVNARSVHEKLHEFRAKRDGFRESEADLQKIVTKIAKNVTGFVNAPISQSDN
jgi:hypothetical protein